MQTTAFLSEMKTETIGPVRDQQQQQQQQRLRHCLLKLHEMPQAHYCAVASCGLAAFGILRRTLAEINYEYQIDGQVQAVSST